MELPFKNPSLWSTDTPVDTSVYPQSQHMTLVLSLSLHTFQVNDTWQLSKAKSAIGKAEVKLILPLL